GGACPSCDLQGVVGLQGALSIALPVRQIVAQGAVSIPCVRPHMCDLHHQAPRAASESLRLAAPSSHVFRHARRASHAVPACARTALPLPVRDADHSPSTGWSSGSHFCTAFTTPSM